MPLFLEGIKSLISKYAPLQIISWVWQDALKPHASKIRWITFLQILSVLTNFSGFWVLYYYVKAIEANQNLSLFHWTFAPRESQILLIIVTSLVGVLLLGSSMLFYTFFKKLIQFNRIFETICVSRLYEAIQQKRYLLPFQKAPILSPYNIKKSLIKDTKFYGRGLSAIIKAVIPIAKIILSLSFMFYLAFSFTLLVVFIMIIGVFFIWKVSRQVVIETRRKEKFIKYYVKDLLNALFTQMSSEELLEKEGMRGYFDAFYGWLLKLEENRLIVNLLIAGTSTILLIVIGQLTIFGNASWALLIGYLLALRYFLTSLQGLNGILKQLSTFYDYIQNYYGILTALSELEEATFPINQQVNKNAEEYFHFQADDDGDDLLDDF